MEARNLRAKLALSTHFVYPLCLPIYISWKCQKAHPLKMSESSEKLTFLSPWYAHVHMETSYLFWTAKKMSSFYMNCSSGLKWVRDHLLSTYAKVSFKLAIPNHWYAQMHQQMHQLLSPSGRSDAHFCLIGINTTSSPIKVLSSCFKS